LRQITNQVKAGSLPKLSNVPMWKENTPILHLLRKD
jgi:hypothetical protein